MDNNQVENAIIIGGGPAGLAAALYLARANMNPLLFAGSPPGGQLTLTSDVENYPGIDTILGPDLIENMRKQAQKFGTRIVDENVLKIDLKAPEKLVQTTNKTYHSRTILIATGAKALWLDLESEQRLRGKGVSACATCDGFFFKNKVVAVVGGGDTAMEDTLTLTKFASKIYLIHRKDSFRASKIMQDRVLHHEKVEVLYNTTVEEVLGMEKVEGLKIKQFSNSNGQSKPNFPINENIETLKVDGLFVAIGHKPDTELFKDQVNLDEKGYIVTKQRLASIMLKEISKSKESSFNEVSKSNSQIMGNWKLGSDNFEYITSSDGVFAAGDNVDYVYRQAATASGTGVAAALEMERYLEIMVE